MVFYLYEQQKDRYAIEKTLVGKYDDLEDLAIWLDGFLYKKYSPDFDKTMELISSEPILNDRLIIHMMNLALQEFELFISGENLTEGGK